MIKITPCTTWASNPLPVPGTSEGLWCWCTAGDGDKYFISPLLADWCANSAEREHKIDVRAAVQPGYRRSVGIRNLERLSLIAPITLISPYHILAEFLDSSICIRAAIHFYTKFIVLKVMRSSLDYNTFLKLSQNRFSANFGRTRIVFPSILPVAIVNSFQIRYKTKR